LTLIPLDARRVMPIVRCSTLHQSLIRLESQIKVEETTILFRPVGHEELELIRKSEFKTFPPRLPGQPIFYPVLNEA
jgi:hypothetical protein